MAAVRNSAAADILATLGIPPTLFASGADSAALREGWRIALHGSIAALAALVRDELREKLDVPSLQISFNALFASDIQGRARSYQSMTKGGMDPERAAALAGLE